MAAIGVLCGEDRVFSDAVIGAINAAEGDASAAYLVLDGTRMAEPPSAAVILDRASPFVPYYQSYLKNAALGGAFVTPDPFWLLGADRFLASAMAAKLGIWTARCILPPNQDHIEGVVQESLRNRKDPLDWAGAVAYLGLPLLVRGNGLMDAPSQLVSSPDGLLAAWNASGTGQLLLQEHVAGNAWLRVIVVGDEARVVPIEPPAYAGMSAGPDSEPPAATADVVNRVSAWGVKFTNAFGLAVNSLDFAVRDGYPYAIDVVNPVPDFRPAAIGEEAFHWVVSRVARHLARLASPGAERPTYRWQAMPQAVSA